MTTVYEDGEGRLYTVLEGPDGRYRTFSDTGTGWQEQPGTHWFTDRRLAQQSLREYARKRHMHRRKEAAGQTEEIINTMEEVQ